ncbi:MULTISPECIES: hypothetical protein [Brevibacillus]|jgi:hypothetical protein|uniref:Uncharacterized protein n=1 Tax=Brevibacillus borstelensis AK1 TaxID=1300222 RepID=M8DT83_9BACL|nr:hypothetical protein [Brevibacillus borstelensis]EMT50141.1 hypothetical protein I532_23899 [Brevibacillus borstelensis AK1]KKX53354.1 hypothetical protein X546_20395 [Brevibacillus borstelensis cifa_chp40]MBE5394205.1 hypothetical protein [Brevibacillus borstelensis]MCC0566159.1 hypothetical protein [Brevibacillus borstelensis]MCM3472472.1 hypothetical protein [Brevibacillus borstelensis]
MKKMNLIRSGLLAIPLLLAGQAAANAEALIAPSQAAVGVASVTEVNVNLDLYQNPIYDSLPSGPNYTHYISYESKPGGISIDSRGRVIASSTGYYKVDVYYSGMLVYTFNFNVGPM